MQPNQPETVIIEEDDDKNQEDVEEEMEEIGRIKAGLISVFNKAEAQGGGNFTCGGALDTFYGLPGLEIAIPSSDQGPSQSTASIQYKPIGLPIITKEQAFDLIQHCSKAPYGKGEATLYNDVVRNTWQLNPEQFRITNPKWNQMIGHLLDDKVKSGLGVPSSTPITCTLYKLLLYEEGGHFDFHRDTEKEDKMFGTLVVQLPSVYEGGEIVVQHGNSEVKYDHSQNAWFTPFYFSFYSDCKHCVKPVTSGYRLCLVYNLMYSGVSSTKPTVVDNKDLLNRISETVKLWKGTPSMASTMPLLVYLLSHKYSKAGLRFDCLKGEDTRKIALLKQYISMNHDLELFLGIMKMTECGYGCDGEIEIEETNYRISHAVDLKNNVVNFGRLDLKASCIVPAHILKELEMDGEEVSFTIIFNIHEKRLKRILAMKDLLLKDGI